MNGITKVEEVPVSEQKTIRGVMGGYLESTDSIMHQSAEIWKSAYDAKEKPAPVSEIPSSHAPEKKVSLFPAVISTSIIALFFIGVFAVLKK